MAVFVKLLPGSPKRAELLVNDEPVKLVSCSIVSLPDLRSLPEEHLQERLQELEVKGGIRYALSHLSRQSVHSKALQKALRRHCLEPVVVAKIIAYCVRQGLLDDEDWIARHVEQWQTKGKSPRAIAAFLRSKGIAADVQPDEQVALRAVIERHFPQLLASDLPYPERARILRSLQRRGFSLSSVQRFLANR